MDTPPEASYPSVDIRYGQGVAVGTGITQFNYFINGSDSPGSARRISESSGGSSLRVFISSASGGLVPYRHAAVEVCHRLGMIPVHMEEFDPERPTPEHVCRREVEGCDVFVLLLAHRYGTRPPGQQLSYSELEYRCAASRPSMPLLSFVVDPAFPWAPPDIDKGADAEALAQFIAHVREEHMVRRFAEVAEFREDLLLALSKLQSTALTANRLLRAPEEPQRETWLPAPPGFHAVPPYVGGAPFTGRAEDLDTLDEWGRSADPVMVVEALGGTGKSALTWKWAQERARTAVGELAGRLWWSFYEGSASMTRFLQEVLAYVSGRSMEQIRRLDRIELANQVLAALRSRRYLLVLDGFERLLGAYHRSDLSEVRDEEVHPDERWLIEPQANDILRQLAAAGPSKILITTRLIPTTLQGRFGRPPPGIRHLRLPGLTDEDTRALLGRLDVHGSESAIAGFFTHLGNHPLLLGVVAGLVRDYRLEPGEFDRWLADPAAGGALRLSDLNLIQRRQHILAVALTELAPGHQRLLGWISALPGKISWPTLQAINPFLTEPQPRTVLSPSLPEVKVQLDLALKDLEERGLLWWDRSSNSYDLHPIIRADAYDRLESTDQVQANDRIRDHFQALPPEDLQRAGSVEDLSRTITIFRALVGAGHLGEAISFWQTFKSVLMDDLGAYATMVELLTPIAKQGTISLSTDLAGAYNLLGQYEEAISLRIRRVADRLQHEDIYNVINGLDGLSLYSANAGFHAVASRYLWLWAALDAAVGNMGDPVLRIRQASNEHLQGRSQQAHELLNEVRKLANVSVKYAEDVEILQLVIALDEQSLTLALLDDAATQIHTWLNRRNLADIRANYFIQQGQFEEALAAALEYERLGRSAGRDVPCRSAFLLAKLGQASEAAVAVEESLIRLPALYLSRRPDYYLARALWELGRKGEAVSHAHEAYKRAWGDGPPHGDHWALRDTRALLEVMRVPEPELPVVDPATILVPLEKEIRAFIAAVEAYKSHSKHENRDDLSRSRLMMLVEGLMEIVLIIAV